MTLGFGKLTARFDGLLLGFTIMILSETADGVLGKIFAFASFSSGLSSCLWDEASLLFSSLMRVFGGIADGLVIVMLFPLMIFVQGSNANSLIETLVGIFIDIKE